MSLTGRPASAIAASEACVARVSTLRPEAREKSVAPTPTIAQRSRCSYGLVVIQCPLRQSLWALKAVRGVPAGNPGVHLLPYHRNFAIFAIPRAEWRGYLKLSEGGTDPMLIQTALDELERGDLSTALLTMCTGGGVATATTLEREYGLRWHQCNGSITC